MDEINLIVEEETVLVDDDADIENDVCTVNTNKRGRAYRRKMEVKAKTRHRMIADGCFGNFRTYYWATRKVDGVYQNMGYILPIRHDSKKEKYWKNYSNRQVRRAELDCFAWKGGLYKKTFDYAWTIDY